MPKYTQGIYEVRNPQKYIGKGKPKYRSSWEMRMFMFLDSHPSIIQWASESIHIPYRNPLTGKQTIYIPDIFMVYQNKNGQQIAELVEIKPSSQSSLMEARSKKDQLSVILNQSKWAAANIWCKRNNIKFRILTEFDLFRNGKA